MTCNLAHRHSEACGVAGAGWLVLTPKLVFSFSCNAAKLNNTTQNHSQSELPTPSTYQPPGIDWAEFFFQVFFTQSCKIRTIIRLAPILQSVRLKRSSII